MEKVIETHNLFIDTACANKESSSLGDDFQLHLNTQSIDADRGQFIRLTLNDFSCYKTWTNVNSNNSVFIMSVEGSISKPAIAKKNYEDLHDLATEFANVVAEQLLADAQTNNSSATTATVSAITPDNQAGINGTSDNIISFKVTFNATHTLTLADIKIQFFEEEGDIYALLGGNRIYGSTPSTENSVVISGTTTEINVQCLYPAQRSTTSHIFLRTSLTTGATETASLSQETNIENASEASYSNILAKIPVNSEFCNFTANTGKEYFIDLRQKHLNNIRLYLTDQHNRRIGRRPTQTGTKTAAGYDNINAIEQSTLGNLSFSCVLRTEVIQGGPINEVQFPRPQPVIPARQTGLLVQTNTVA